MPLLHSIKLKKSHAKAALNKLEGTVVKKTDSLLEKVGLDPKRFAEDDDEHFLAKFLDAAAEVHADFDTVCKSLEEEGHGAAAESVRSTQAEIEEEHEHPSDLNDLLLNCMPATSSFHVDTEDADVALWQSCLELVHSYRRIVEPVPESARSASAGSDLEELHQTLADAFDPQPEASARSALRKGVRFVRDVARSARDAAVVLDHAVRDEVNEAKAAVQNGEAYLREVALEAVKNAVAHARARTDNEYLENVIDVAEALGSVLLAGNLKFSEPFDPLWLSVGKAFVAARLLGVDPRGNYIAYSPTMQGTGLRFEEDGDMVVGIIGDWGTGTDDAFDVLAELWQRMRASGVVKKYILHLGDIYYSGTVGEVNKRFVEVFRRVIDPDMFTENQFTNEVTKDLRILAVPGNHEMYAGGAGFARLRQLCGQQATFFSLRNPVVNIVGLDTGITDLSPVLQNNKLVELTEDQLQFLQSALQDNGGRRPVLMSHHQPFSAFEGVPHGTDGDNVNHRLVDGVQQAAKDLERYWWVWGHEHRFTAYNYDESLRLTGRCLGNSAVPEVMRSLYEDPLFEEEHPYHVESLPLWREDKLRFDCTYGMMWATADNPRVEYFHLTSTRPVITDNL